MINMSSKEMEDYRDMLLMSQQDMRDKEPGEKESKYRSNE